MTGSQLQVLLSVHSATYPWINWLWVKTRKSCFPSLSFSSFILCSVFWAYDFKIINRNWMCMILPSHSAFHDELLKGNCRLHMWRACLRYFNDGLPDRHHFKTITAFVVNLCQSTWIVVQLRQSKTTSCCRQTSITSERHFSPAHAQALCTGHMSSSHVTAHIICPTHPTVVETWGRNSYINVHVKMSFRY